MASHSSFAGHTVTSRLKLVFDLFKSFLQLLFLVMQPLSFFALEVYVVEDLNIYVSTDLKLMLELLLLVSIVKSLKLFQLSFFDDLL